MLAVSTVQKIRGDSEHFKSANSIWESLCGPVGASLGYGDEEGLWISRPFLPIWSNFWDTMRINLDITEPESRWGSVFRGSFLWLLRPEEGYRIQKKPVNFSDFDRRKPNLHQWNFMGSLRVFCWEPDFPGWCLSYETMMMAYVYAFSNWLQQ